MSKYTNSEGDVVDLEDNDKIVDRCCCECGDHFDGSTEDDYCSDCFDKLPMEDLDG